jgi:hypothetical protein
MIETAYSEGKGSHGLANLMVRGLGNMKIHVYPALCAQIIKRIGAMLTDMLVMPPATPSLVRV